MKPKIAWRHVDLGQYVPEDVSYRAKHAWYYGRNPVLPDYVSPCGPDYEAAVRDNVWSERERNQRLDNAARGLEWRERLRWRGT